MEEWEYKVKQTERKETCKALLYFCAPIILIFAIVIARDQWIHMQLHKAEAEAARYGVSAEEFESECTDYDGISFPTDPEIIAAVCWEIRHPRLAEESGWEGHIQEVAHWAVNSRDADPNKIEAEPAEELPIEIELKAQWNKEHPNNPWR